MRDGYSRVLHSPSARGHRHRMRHLVSPARCPLCGEPFRTDPNWAEMPRPDEEIAEFVDALYGNVVAHAECGFSNDLSPA